MRPWTPESTTAARVHTLAPGGEPLAFVEHPHGVWAARSVLDLVDGIWFATPQHAHSLLRARVITNTPASEVDRAIVQLCSRKLGAGVRGQEGPVPEVPVHWMDEAAAGSRAHHVARSALPLPEVVAPDWLRPPPAEGPLRHRDRAVRALLVAPDGEILLAAANTNGVHRLRHAEVNLLQAWGRRLPACATVLVGLQCCRMCAALLVEAAEGQLNVRYVEAEAGRFGRGTALQARGWEEGLRPAPSHGYGDLSTEPP